MCIHRCYKERKHDAVQGLYKEKLRVYLGLPVTIPNSRDTILVVCRSSCRLMDCRWSNQDVLT